MKRWNCYYGTPKKPCTLTLKAIESAILDAAVEHIRKDHPRCAQRVPDLAARLCDEVEDDVDKACAGAGGYQFICQDLAAPLLWRCPYVQLGDSPVTCRKAVMEHFAPAHAGLVPDEETIRAHIRVAGRAPRSSWEWSDVPLRDRWLKRERP